MKTSVRAGTLHRDIPLAFAFVIGALSLASVSVHAANLDPVTISAPMVKDAGKNTMTLAPLEKITATAVIGFNPVTLTTHSGVALLEDSVRAAARRACGAAASSSLHQTSLYEQDCVLRVVQSAQPQVDAAIARARSDARG
jgi:UrcA family protein